MTLTLQDAEELGVRRLSVGSGLARAAYGAFFQAAKAMREKGKFQFGEEIDGLSELWKLFPERDL